VVASSFDPPHEHALVADRSAGPEQAVAGLRGLGGQLLRVVEVRVHPDGVVALDHPAEGVGDPGRERHGQPRPEAHHLDVGDAPELGDQPLQLVVGEDERVPAREEDVADLGRPADPVEPDLELALLHDPLFVADHAHPQAEPAVERALVVHAEGDPVRVRADHVLHRRVGHLVERVGHARRIVQLDGPGHHDPLDAIDNPESGGGQGAESSA
jgi:hypothetical protein